MATASSIDELVQRRQASGLAKQRQFEFASIEDAVRDLKAGRMIVVIDDEDRENEGDLTTAAEMIAPEAINFMATHGRGLICLAMTGERLDYEILPVNAARCPVHHYHKDGPERSAPWSQRAISPTSGCTSRPRSWAPSLPPSCTWASPGSPRIDRGSPRLLSTKVFGHKAPEFH
jgi:3,4-dihydroxy-2-butanone 4-phosphate synthase